MKIWVVIPAYNEEATLTEVILKVKKCVDKIVVIDDGSGDKTGLIAKKLGVKLLKNKNNLGYAKTLDKGLRFAFSKDAEYCITWDADGQHSSRNLARVISILNKHHPDILVGKRNKRNRFMEIIFGWYTKKMYGFSDPLCGIKAYSKNVFRDYKSLETGYTIGTEMLIRAAMIWLFVILLTIRQVRSVMGQKAWSSSVIFPPWV